MSRRERAREKHERERARVAPTVPRVCVPLERTRARALSRALFSAAPLARRYAKLGLHQQTLLDTALVLRGQWWRLATPMLLHGSPMHLLVNVLALRNV